MLTHYIGISLSILPAVNSSHEAKNLLPDDELMRQADKAARMHCLLFAVLLVVYFVSINTQYILFDRKLCSLNLLVPPKFII